MNEKVEFNFIDVSFKARDILSVPEPYLSFALASSAASNDMVVFLRMIVFNFNEDSSEEVVNRISNLHRIALERNLNAKLVEFIKLFEDFSKKVSRSKTMKESLDLTSINQAVHKLKSSKEYELSVFMRNKVTNHYIGSDMTDLAKELDEDYDLQIHVNTKFGNSYHAFAEEVGYVGSLLKFKIDQVDADTLRKWTLNAVAELAAMHQSLIVEIIAKFMPAANISAHTVKVEDHYVAKMDGMISPIPLFAREDFDVSTYEAHLKKDV